MGKTERKVVITKHKQDCTLTEKKIEIKKDRQIEIFTYFPEKPRGDFFRIGLLWFARYWDLWN